MRAYPAAEQADVHQHGVELVELDAAPRARGQRVRLVVGGEDGAAEAAEQRASSRGRPRGGRRRRPDRSARARRRRRRSRCRSRGRRAGGPAASGGPAEVGQPGRRAARRRARNAGAGAPPSTARAGERLEAAAAVEVGPGLAGRVRLGQAADEVVLGRGRTTGAPAGGAPRARGRGPRRGRGAGARASIHSSARKRGGAAPRPRRPRACAGRRPRRASASPSASARYMPGGRVRLVLHEQPPPVGQRHAQRAVDVAARDGLGATVRARRPPPRPPPRSAASVTARGGSAAQVREQTRGRRLDHVEDVRRSRRPRRSRGRARRGPRAAAGSNSRSRRTLAAASRVGASGAGRRRSARSIARTRSKRAKSAAVNWRARPVHRDAPRRASAVAPRVGRRRRRATRPVPALSTTTRAVQPRLGDAMAHHRLGRGRAADVAQADEADPAAVTGRPRAPSAASSPAFGLVAGPQLVAQLPLRAPARAGGSQQVAARRRRRARRGSPRPGWLPRKSGASTSSMRSPAWAAPPLPSTMPERDRLGMASTTAAATSQARSAPRPLPPHVRSDSTISGRNVKTKP